MSIAGCDDLRACLAGSGWLLVALARESRRGTAHQEPAHDRRGRIHAPCAEGDLTAGRQFSRLCYSDIVMLYRTEHLADGRFPYLDPCPPDPSRPAAEPVCDEYPVLTMYTMWLATRSLERSRQLPPVECRAAEHRRRRRGIEPPRRLPHACVLVRSRSDPAGVRVHELDLIAVAFATAGTLAFLRGRDRVSGTLLGLGAAAKLYPALLVVAFVAERIRRGDRRGAARVVLWAGGAWLLLNLPFALTGYEGWSRFFRLSANRPPDLDSLWFIGCRWVTGEFPCLHSPFGLLSPVQLFSFMSGAVFAGTVALVWWLRARRDPAFPVWTLGLPLLILFVLTSKVYSPQFSLWLLPWFALALPGLKRIPALGLFAAFEAADVLVFVTRFTWFGIGGPDQWVFEVAVVLRAIVLLVCVVAWVLGPSPTMEAEEAAPDPHRRKSGTVSA